jgi:hypothetical protein
MYLVQVLLPLADNDGNEFPEDVLHGIQAELHKLFGALTAYTRAPAKGVGRMEEPSTRTISLSSR